MGYKLYVSIVAPLC